MLTLESPMLLSEHTLGLTPKITAGKLIQLVHELAASGRAPSGGDRMHVLALLDIALQAPRLGILLVEAILEGVATHDTPTGAAVAAHLKDAVWAKPYPLHAQEYAPWFTGGPLLHVGLTGAIQQSSWPRLAILRLRDAVANQDGIAATATAMQEDFATIAAEAAERVTRIGLIKALRKTSGMHVVQIEAYLSALFALDKRDGDLRGCDVVDLGCGEGELVSFLRAQGARVAGSEVDPHAGLLGVPEQHQFDVVFATGLFEPGAFMWPGMGVNHYEFDRRGDELIAAAARLLRPDGVLVVRNVSYPIPFAPHVVASLGLVYQHVLMPLATPTFGGRTAVWRRVK